jgi:hypothetical protein
VPNWGTACSSPGLHCTYSDCMPDGVRVACIGDRWSWEMTQCG